MLKEFEDNASSENGEELTISTDCETNLVGASTNNSGNNLQSALKLI